MRPINERLIRISSGYISCPYSLENGSEVSLLVRGTITKKEYQDDQDGGDTEVCVLKGEDVEIIKAGNVIVGE